MRKPVKRNLQQKILEMIPSTSNAMAAALGVSKEAVNATIVAMMSRNEIHVARWLVGHKGPPIRVFNAGRGVNAAKPRPSTNAEKMARARRKKAAILQKRKYSELDPYSDNLAQMRKMIFATAGQAMPGRA